MQGRIQIIESDRPGFVCLFIHSFTRPISIEPLLLLVPVPGTRDTARNKIKSLLLKKKSGNKYTNITCQMVIYIIKKKRAA